MKKTTCNGLEIEVDHKKRLFKLSVGNMPCAVVGGEDFDTVVSMFTHIGADKMQKNIACSLEDLIEDQ